MGGVVTRSGKPSAQEPKEYARFLELVRSLKVKRYLEIGCRHGDTFYDVMKTTDAVFGVAVDLPWTPTSEVNLKACVAELPAVLISGNSRDKDVIEATKLYAPFDLILIDGDHTFQGVKADWDNYSPMAPVIALHDIASPEDNTSDGLLIGVPNFWRHLCFTQKHCRFEEIVTPGSAMGFGIIHQ